MTSKLHGFCDSKGGLLRLHLSEGQCSDFAGTDVVLKGLRPAAAVIGDQGHDRDQIRKMLAGGAGDLILHPTPPPQETSPLQQEAGSQASQNRDSLFPTEELAASCNPLRPATSSVLPSSCPPTFSSGDES